jgi:hypothetical protein
MHSHSVRSGLLMTILGAALLLTSAPTSFAANYASINGTTCQTSSGTTAQLSSGILNTSTNSYALVFCPLHRANARSTAGADIAAYFRRGPAPIGPYFYLYGYSYDPYGNVIGSTTLAFPAAPGDNPPIPLNHLPSVAWGTYALYAYMGPGDTLHVITLSES